MLSEDLDTFIFVDSRGIYALAAILLVDPLAARCSPARRAMLVEPMVAALRMKGVVTQLPKPYF